MSGSSGALKSLNPTSRRRRRCEKHALELKYDEFDLMSNVDPFPVTPITPPAAFLPTEHKHKSTRKKGEKQRKQKKLLNTIRASSILLQGIK